MTALDLLLVAARNVGGSIVHAGGCWRIVAGGAQLAAGPTPDRCLRALARRELS